MIPDEVKVVLGAAVVIAIIVAIAWGLITANNNMTLAKWREAKASIVVGGVTIDPNDIKSVSDGGRIELHLKNGKCIISSEWTIIYDESPKTVK